jgi:hypothetical protein
VSWNLYLVTKDEDGNEEWKDVISSMTTNLTPMWAKAIPFLEVSRDFDGKKCEDILLDLQIAVSDVHLNPESYKKLNPDNGWGDFRGFYLSLLDLFTMCRKHPSGRLAWSG